MHLHALFFSVCFCAIQSATPCHWIQNLFVMAKDKNDVEFNQTLSRCIERTAFDGKTVIQIYVRHQTIPTLGKDSVRNLIHLNTISFWGCKMDRLDPGAFRNVPELKNVQLSYGNLKEIPRGVFDMIPSMELLRIHDNEIDIIEDQAFANLPSLKKIYGSNNRMEYWNREWFTNTTSLEIMDFQSNQIRTIPRRAFASLTKLRQIFFDFNEISVIHADAFKGISNLEYLGLRYNRLTEIKEDIFPNELKIRSFLIDANYLNFLPNEVLRKVSVKDITFDNNPWKCPCLDRINFWLYSTNGTARIAQGCVGSKIPVCAFSKTFSQTCLEHVDSELTSRYISILKNLEEPPPKYCARLD